MTIKADKIHEQALRELESSAPLGDNPDGSCPAACALDALAGEAAAAENFQPCDIEARLPKVRLFPRW